METKRTSRKSASKKSRCWWCGDDPLYVDYHDNEWGRPVKNDLMHFEHLILEGFQAGLSWFTILKKRENFRRAFKKFDPKKVARYSKRDIQKLLKDTGIIRHRGKIEAAVSNAQAFLKLREEFGSFGKYLATFTGKQVIRNARGVTRETILARTELSDRIAKDLKKRGFKFVGSTTVYSHLQATGIIDDHVVDCFRYRGKKRAATKV